MMLENVHPDYGSVELWIGGLNDLIMFMFSVFYAIKSFEHKFKKCA